jgi:hypothetical protein
MKWLADNYKWLFDGIGALVIIGVVGFLLRRFRLVPELPSHLEQPRQEKTDSKAELRAEDSQPERFNPNIQMTGAGVAFVSERGRGVWKEDVQGTEQAILIQFTNEARPGVRNVGGLVKAALVYKNEAEVLRIGREFNMVNCSSRLEDVMCTNRAASLLKLNRMTFRFSKLSV